MPSIADFIAVKLSDAAKDWKSESQKHSELVGEIEALKKSLQEIKKLSRHVKSKYSQRQISLLDLERATASILHDLEELENSEE